MLNKIADNNALQYEIDAIADSLSRLAEQENDGIVSGLDVTASGNALLLSSGEFVLWHRRGSFPQTTVTVPDTSPGASGFLVVQAQVVDSYAEDPYRAQVLVRSDVVFELRVVDHVDAATQLALCHYQFTSISRDENELVLTQQPFTRTAVITEAQIVYALNARDVTVAVTGPNGAFTEVLDPVASQTYYCNHTEGWIRFAYRDIGVQVVITGTEGVPVPDKLLVVDISNDRYTLLRPVAGNHDVRHRNTNGRAATSGNAHATGFNDVQSKIPLPMQLWDTGYGIYQHLNQAQVPGELQTLIVTAGITDSGQGRFQHDVFGTQTGICGSQYITVPGFPLKITSVNTVSAVNGKQPIAYTRYQDNVCFPETMDFTEVVSGNRVPLSVEITYGSIPDYAPGTALGNQIELFPGNKLVCFSEGFEVPTSSTSKYVDFSKYTGLPLDVEVALDKNGDHVIEPKFLDAAAVSSGQSGFTTPISVGSPSRLAITLQGTDQQALKPPTGYLTIDPTTFWGTRDFIYCYFRGEKQVTSTTQTIPGLTDGNYDGSRLYRSVTSDSPGVLVDRGSWNLDLRQQQAQISDEIFARYNQADSWFNLVTDAATSSRNADGAIRVIGTHAKPGGASATASLTLTGSVFRTLDTVSTTLPDGTVLTKTWHALDYGFTGATTADVSQSLAQCISYNQLVLLGVRAGWLKLFRRDTSSVTLRLTSDAPITDLRLSVQSPGSNLALTIADPGDGVIYEATITVLGIPYDSTITLSPDQYSGAVTLHYWDSTTGFTSSQSGFLYAAQLAFQSDAKFSAQHMLAAVISRSLVFTAPSGSAGNSLVISQTTTNNALAVTGYHGGDDTLPTGAAALQDTVIEIQDGYAYDPNGFFVIYATDDLATASEKVFHKITEVRQNQGQTHYRVEANLLDLTTAPSTLDLGKELALQVLISGTDVSGSSISETVTVTPQVFCDYLETDRHRANEFQFVRTSNVFSTVSSWVVVSSSNTGACKLVLLSEAVSGIQALFPVFRAFWNGKGLQEITDARPILATTTADDNAIVTGESVESAFNMLQLLNTML